MHTYVVDIEWTGNKGTGTSHYAEYDRSHVVRVANKEDMHCSSDTIFRGDGSKYNPEDLFLSAVSACHMLWYLHLCADAGVVVTHYRDKATGVLFHEPGVPGRFTEICLHPHVVVSDASMIDRALELHHSANSRCFMANTLNIAVQHEPVVECRD
ncbi:MAG: OsmC family protein [Candidatus Kapaibacterium sp.]|jgi:organic hydroperoxide reductase OsmC/OhrA